MVLFPIGFLLVLILFAISYTGEQFSSEPTEDFSNVSGNVGGEDTYVEVEGGGSYSFNIWDTAGAIIILTIATSAGIVAGFNILGSGMSDTSQGMIFDAILFGGLWGCLSAIVMYFMFANTLTTLLWSVITIIYIIGIGAHMGRNG